MTDKEREEKINNILLTATVILLGVALALRMAGL